jgi:uncharacterized membrane protein YphA (DoxX/SURF4 family)
MQWEWIGALIARIAVGLLFLLSGTGKLLITERRESVRETIRKAGLPAPNLTATVISTIEFLCGAALIAGFLTPLCCIMLIGVMLGALTTTVLPGIKATSFLDWLGQFLPARSLVCDHPGLAVPGQPRAIQCRSLVALAVGRRD